MVRQAVSSTSALSKQLPDEADLTPARRRVFEMALEMFGDRGFHAVSVRDLAMALDKAPTALYAHVGSKQDLLFRLVELGVQTHRDAVHAAMLGAGPDPVDQIAAMVRAHVLIHLEYPAMARVVNRESRSLTEEQQAALLAIRGGTEALIGSVIAQGVRQGAFDPIDSGLAITAIGSLGIRAAEWWPTVGTPSPAHIADVYAAFVHKLLSKPELLDPVLR